MYQNIGRFMCVSMSVCVVLYTICEGEGIVLYAYFEVKVNASMVLLSAFL